MGLCSQAKFHNNFAECEPRSTSRTSGAIGFFFKQHTLRVASCQTGVNISSTTRETNAPLRLGLVFWELEPGLTGYPSIPNQRKNTRGPLQKSARFEGKVTKTQETSCDHLLSRPCVGVGEAAAAVIFRQARCLTGRSTERNTAAVRER